jgi:hypothetical protein
MNEQQTAALWATAFRDLANATSMGTMQIPQSMDIWTHDVPLDKLLAIADFATPDPLKITILEDRTRASVIVPVGRPLILPIVWHLIGPIGPDDVKKISDHNEQCLTGDGQVAH